MASTLTGTQSHNNPHFIVGKSYENALNQSIESLLSTLQNPNSRNSTNLVSEFQQFVLAKADPPLESIWVYAALTFTYPSKPETEPLNRISDIKDLFRLIVSCSASCNPIKSIALVAPVIYHLHNFILDVKGSQLRSKRERKVNGEIRGLLDSVLGYVSVCCSGFDGNFDELEVLIRSMRDLISFWLVDCGVENMNLESLRTFFPLLSDSVVKKVSVEGFGMTDLAGFVVAEAFLLKLCWKIQEEGFGDKIRNELRSWVVGSITGLRSSYFYVTLLNVLLEPVLPITSLVNIEHEVDLRKVLFDAVILVEYSFVSPESLAKLPMQHAKRTIIAKLLATHEAIELFREHKDQAKAIPYMNAFANSSLPGLIIKWIKNEIGNEFNPSEPKGSSPRAFLRWLLNIEDRGIKIFDDDMSEFRTAINSTEKCADGEDGTKRDSDLLFYIDHKGQEEVYESDEDEKMRESESMNAAFTAAAHSMQSVEKRRKRKTKDGEKRKQVKSVKYKALDHSSLSADRGSDNPDNGRSDLENQSSDEDMETRN